MKNNKALSPEQSIALINVLKTRFEQNMSRHKGLEWAKVQAKLEANPEKLWSLDEMEITGGEPDVVGYDEKTGEYLFYDCSAESPKERRSLCYDRTAHEAAFCPRYNWRSRQRSAYARRPTGSGQLARGFRFGTLCRS
jgi:hypothetical protein